MRLTSSPFLRTSNNALTTKVITPSSRTLHSNIYACITPMLNPIKARCVYPPLIAFGRRDAMYRVKGVEACMKVRRDVRGSAREADWKERRGENREFGLWSR